MPRKDPMTGCMVMTMPEFLADEAKREGKGRTGGDVLGDIYTQMDADNRKREDELRSPKIALQTLNEMIGPENEFRRDDGQPELPKITKVLTVLSAKCSQHFSGSSTGMTAEVLAGGKAYFALARESNWSGTMWEPPDSDGEFWMAEFHPSSEPWVCGQCGVAHPTGERHWEHIQYTNDHRLVVHRCPKCTGYADLHRKRGLRRR